MSNEFLINDYQIKVNYLSDQFNRSGPDSISS